MEKITEGISHVAKQTVPAAVASLQGIRKALGVAAEPISASSVPVAQITSNMDTQQRDIESELSKLLGEDGVSDVITDIFH